MAADFNGTTSRVNIGSLPDIDSLLEFTISSWLFTRSLGEGNEGKILDKANTSNATRFELSGLSGGYVGLYGKVRCATTSAESLKAACLELNEWHHVAFTYSDSGDRKVHIHIDGAEVTGYNYQIAGVGARTSDAADDAIIGNRVGYDRTFDGLMSAFLIHQRALPAASIQWLAHDIYHTPPAQLCVDVWEDWRTVRTSKAPNGILVFQFDDGYANACTSGLPIFAAHGKQAVSAVVSSLIGVGDRLSAAQILQLKTAGWDIASHSKTHADPQSLSDAQLRTEMLDSRTALQAIAGQVKHYAWPLSCPSEMYRQICVDYYDSATDGGLFDLAYFNAYAIGHVTIDNPAALASYKAYMDAAKAGKQLLTFIMHSIDVPNQGTLNDLLDYADLIGIPVLTRTQALARTSAVCPFKLNGRASLRCRNLSASNQPLRTWGFVTPQNGYVTFDAYTDGGTIDATIVKPYLSAAGINQLTEFNYTPLGAGKWLCWSPFTFGNQLLHLGAEIMPGKTVYISKPAATPLP